jgi:hypothetical protein
VLTQFRVEASSMNPSSSVWVEQHTICMMEDSHEIEASWKSQGSSSFEASYPSKRAKFN